MSESSSSNNLTVFAQTSKNKKCDYCNIIMGKQSFLRPHSDNLQHEHATFISTSSSQINNAPDTLQVNSNFENYDNFEPTLEANFFENEFANILQTEEIEHIISLQSDEYNNINTILYCMDEVERFIAIQFQNAESSEEPAKFEFEIELDSGLLDAIELGQDLETNPLNLEKIKSSFAQLTKILTLLLESG
ncbi:12885_t:CDS:2, partial [Cetraspora pellucida]